MTDCDRYIIKAMKVPYPRHTCEWGITAGVMKVNYLECITLRKAVLEFAKYFRREFHYDFVQYNVEPDRESNNRNTAAFLFTNSEYTHRRVAYGACCFRYRKGFIDAHDHWALQWIWLHPYERCKGRLSAIWPFFEREFGNFMIEHPHSPGMKAFLSKDMEFTHSYDAVRKEKESQDG